MTGRSIFSVGPPRDDGVVLITVIWLLALLGGLVTAMSLYASAVLGAIDTYNDQPRAEAVLQAALQRAAADVLASDAQPPGPGAEAGSGAGSADVGTARASWSAVNESARIDVNLAKLPLLTGLFTQLDATPDAAASYAARIVGLRGPSADQRPAPASASGNDVNEESPAAIRALAGGTVLKDEESDRHKPFADVLQLLRVPGLPPGLMARAAPYLTTFGSSPSIDAHLASPLLVAALPGLTRERLRTVLAARATIGADLSDALGDAKAFTTDKRSPATRVTIEARLADGFTRSAEVVIVHYPDDSVPFRVLAWQDGVPSRQTPVAEPAP